MPPQIVTIGNALTSRAQYLDENLGAANLKLTPEELVEVRAVAEKADAAHGPRYPTGYDHLTLADTPPL